jgi:16S rRNA (guanine966-N2)-methyltransferase
VREAIASALVARGAVAGARVLDLWAGTGALGFEMLSRGARSLVAVDRDRVACRGWSQAARELALEDRARVLALDLGRDPDRTAAAIGPGPYDLVLADPPYADAAQAPPLIVALGRAGLLGSGAVAVVEHAGKEALALPEGLALGARYRYGDTAVTIATYEDPR